MPKTQLVLAYSELLADEANEMARLCSGVNGHVPPACSPKLSTWLRLYFSLLSPGDKIRRSETNEGPGVEFPAVIADGSRGDLMHDVLSQPLVLDQHLPPFTLAHRFLVILTTAV